MAETFTYDVFLSYCAKDKAAAQELAERIKSDGLRVWFDEWEVERDELPATNQERIEWGLVQSRVLVLCLSGNLTEAEWKTFERQTASFRDPAIGQRRCIPLRLDDSDISPMLGVLAWFDWRTRSAEQYARLLAACHPFESRAQRKLAAEKKKREKDITFRDKSRVGYVALSHDGRLALSAFDLRTVRVWDVESGRFVRALEGHSDIVWSAGMSRNGQVALSGSADNTLRVWKVGTGRCLGVLKGHTDKVLSVAISWNGQLALSGSKDQDVRVWQVEGGRCLRVLQGHSGTVWTVALSDDGRRALSGSGDKKISLWDVESGVCVHQLEGHTGAVFGVAFNEGGRLALSGSADKTVRLWDVENGRCLQVFEGHTGDVLSVALSGNGRLALSGAMDNTVRVWNVESGRCVRVLEGIPQ